MDNSSYVLVDSQVKFKHMIESLQNEDVLVLDLEATGLDDSVDKIVGFVLAGFNDPNVYYTPIRHTSSFAHADQLPADFVEEQIIKLIDGKELVGHNIICFDYDFLMRLPGAKDIKVKIRSDTMAEAYVMGLFPKVNQKDLARICYKADVQDIDDIYPAACEKIKNKLIVHFEQIPVEIAFKYSCDDGFYCRKLHLDFYNKVKDRFIYKLEMEVLWRARKFNITGIRVDYQRCEIEFNRLIKEAEAIDNAVHRYLKRCYDIHEHFDFGSSPQVANLLIDRFGIFEEVLTEKGNRSTSKKNFEGLRDANPIVNAIFTYREIIKAATGAFGIYPDFEGDDGRMHPSLLTCHVITGRTAIANPNTQQLANDAQWVIVDFDDESANNCKICSGGRCTEQLGTKEHCKAVKFKVVSAGVRDVFIPRDGYMFVEGDYSQIELMVIAAIAHESKMLQAFRDNEDIHAKTASVIYQKPIDKINNEERQVGKTTNFRFNYGGGPGGLAHQLGISMRQAKSIVEAHKAGYPMLDRFAEKSYLYARQTGCVETLFGRIRYCPEFVSTEPKIAARGKRLATNIPVQGGAADIAKIGMVRQDIALIDLEKEGYINFLCNFVHDSFLWEVPIISLDAKEQMKYLKFFTERMSKALCVDILTIAVVQKHGVSEFPKLKIDFKYGMTYGSLIKDKMWYELAEKGEISFDLPKVVGVQVPTTEKILEVKQPEIIFNIEILDGVGEDKLKELDVLLKANPGNNLFVLRFSGEVIRLDSLRTSLGMNDYLTIKSIVPCNMFCDSLSVNSLIASQIEL